MCSCVWGPEVDINDISNDFGLLFIEPGCLSELQDLPILLVSLANLFWGPCLQVLRLELHVGAHALLAFMWILGIGLCS